MHITDNSWISKMLPEFSLICHRNCGYWLLLLSDCLCCGGRIRVFTSARFFSIQRENSCQLLPITSARVDRFSKFFHNRTRQWLPNEMTITDRISRLVRVATLPCETLVFKNYRISISMHVHQFYITPLHHYTWEFIVQICRWHIFDNTIGERGQ